MPLLGAVGKQEDRTIHITTFRSSEIPRIIQDERDHYPCRSALEPQTFEYRIKILRRSHDPYKDLG